MAKYSDEIKLYACQLANEGMTYRDIGKKLKIYHQTVRGWHQPHIADKIRDYKQKYHIENHDRLLKVQRQYYKNNKVSIDQKHRDYYNDNREKCQLKHQLWYQNNKEKQINNQRFRLKTNIQFKLQRNLRRRLSIAIKRNYKAGSAVADLGCSIEEFKKYIESLWLSGMSWKNWSLQGWHLDHIIPLSAFDLTDRKQLLIACNYRNIQPMWAKDNLSKGNKINYISNVNR